MLDPVVIPTLYFFSIVQLVLEAGVVYYAVRVTKITGSFRAWTMIIVAFVVLSVRNVISLLLTLALPSDQIGSLIESIGVTTTIVTQVVNVAAVVILFIGFFSLVKRFESQAKAPSRAS